MRGLPVTLVLLLLASAAAGAEGQGGAPLESSKQALKTLQADQAAKDGAAATGKLTDGLPRLETPMPGATLAPEFSPTGDARQRDRDLKKERQQNWLLDGVDQLGRPTGSRKPTGAKGANGQADDDPDQVRDRSKDGSMLQLYADQKKEAEGKAATRRTNGPRPDPIAPFLQDWLGNSPVRGKFFDEFVRNASGDTTAQAGLDAAGFRPGGPGTPLTVETNRAAPAEAPQSNPYLAAMESPTTTGPGSAHANTPVTASAASGGPVAAPAVPAINPIPDSRPAVKKPPLPALTDNEKYFPQQKKF